MIRMVGFPSSRLITIRSISELEKARLDTSYTSADLLDSLIQITLQQVLSIMYQSIDVVDIFYSTNKNCDSKSQTFSISIGFQFHHYQRHVH